ncbi:MAG: hypothetical protein IKH82_03545 [Clostridiales bacterium]|nr:hypothetical protein [Clostridiales bacterium]MBR6987124.1 hypothetical protein [Clostridiales bacterium]
MKNVTMKAGSIFLAALCMASVFTGCGNKEVEDIVTGIASEVNEQDKKDRHDKRDDEIFAERVTAESMAEREDIQAMPVDVQAEPVETGDAIPVETEESRIQLMDIYEIGTYENETLTWIVIDVKDGKALLLSEKVIDLVPYNTEKTEVTWETCSLRKWLNEDLYYGSFTDEERQMIVKTTVNNKDLPDEGCNYGSDTEDYLYVLSYREMLDTAADCDEYAKPSYTQIALEHHNNVRVSYWRRDPGMMGDGTVALKTLGTMEFDGRVQYFCDDVDSPWNGVRPAMWVDINMLANN